MDDKANGVISFELNYESLQMKEIDQYRIEFYYEINNDKENLFSKTFFSTSFKSLDDDEITIELNGTPKYNSLDFNINYNNLKDSKITTIQVLDSNGFSLDDNDNDWSWESNGETKTNSTSTMLINDDGNGVINVKGSGLKEINQSYSLLLRYTANYNGETKTKEFGVDPNEYLNNKNLKNSSSFLGVTSDNIFYDASYNADTKTINIGYDPTLINDSYISEFAIYDVNSNSTLFSFSERDKVYDDIIQYDPSNNILDIKLESFSNFKYNENANYNFYITYPESASSESIEYISYNTKTLIDPNYSVLDATYNDIFVKQNNFDKDGNLDIVIGYNKTKVHALNKRNYF